jgi:adenylate cyclase class 2
VPRGLLFSWYNGSCTEADVTLMIEREVKLRFDSPQDARTAILAAGATPLRCRRLQEDALLDADDESLRRRQCVLRVRTEAGRSLLTFKGPVQPGTMKIRDEYETVVADGEALQHVLEELGLHVWFRYEKYREEYAAPNVTIALDETPVGTYVELEGDEDGIRAMTRALGRTDDDYILHSYRRLFIEHREQYGLGSAHMVFREE